MFIKLTRIDYGCNLPIEEVRRRVLNGETLNGVGEMMLNVNNVETIKSDIREFYVEENLAQPEAQWTGEPPLAGTRARPRPRTTVHEACTCLTTRDHHYTVMETYQEVLAKVEAATRATPYNTRGR